MRMACGIAAATSEASPASRNKPPAHKVGPMMFSRKGTTGFSRWRNCEHPPSRNYSGISDEQHKFFCIIPMLDQGSLTTRYRVQGEKTFSWIKPEVAKGCA